MNFEQFKYLSEIHKNKSISKASEKLYMSTQALSISIKNLEDELKVPLLLRSQKGATLTPEGEKILEAYSLFRAKLIDIAAEYAHQTDDKAEFYFEVNYKCLYYLNKMFLTELFSFFPNIKFLIEENTSENICTAISEEKIELGIIFLCYNSKEYFSAFPENIEFIPLANGKFLLESSDRKLLAQISSLNDAVKYPIIAQKGNDLSTNNFKQILSQEFPNANIQLTNSDEYYSTIISRGECLGLSIAFNELLPRNENYFSKQIDSEYQIQIGLAYNKKNVLSPLAEKILNRIIKIVS